MNHAGTEGTGPTAVQHVAAIRHGLAAVQHVAEPGATATNLAAAESGIREAARRGARLIVLPECGISGYDVAWFGAGAPGATPFPHPAFDRLAALSRELGVAVAVNDLQKAAGPGSGGGPWYDTTLLFDRGALVGQHHKITLTVAERAAGILPGDQPAEPVSLAGSPLRAAPMICYEYAFPELAADLAARGANCIALSSAVRAGYEHLREVRHRARAQDNGLYLVAANALGHGLRGASMIVDPRGDVIARADMDGPDVIVAGADGLIAVGTDPGAPPSSDEHAHVAGVLHRARLVAGHG